MPNNSDTKKQWEPGQEPMLEPAMDPIKKRASRKPKPIIEGINSVTPTEPEAQAAPVQTPVVSPSLQSTLKEKPETKLELTDAEKVLMSSGNVVVKEPIIEAPKETVKPQITIQKEDPRLLSKSAINRANGAGNKFRNLLLLIILALLAIGAFELFSWYQNRPTGLVPVNNQNPTPTETVMPTVTPVVSATPVPSATSVPSATPTPVPTTAKSLKITSTPTGYLNVRETPSTSGKQLMQVHPGEVYQYTDAKNGWYQISLPGGQSGWVTSQYVTLQ